MLIKVKVHAGSRESTVEQRAPDRYEVWTKAPAERGLANRAVLELLRKYFRCQVGNLAPTGRALRIVKGARSPSKIVEIP